MSVDLATVLAVLAVVLVLAFRIQDREKATQIIETRLESFNDSARKLLDDARSILKQSDKIMLAQHLRPDLSTYLTNQWRFIEKMFRNRYEKHLLCKYIVEDFISDGATVLLDSGSTIDLVAFELLSSRKRNINVHSNNVFAAMHLVGTDLVKFHLFGGHFSDKYAAVYSVVANNRLGDIGLNTIILSSVSLSYSKGLTVDAGDTDNLEFKQAALSLFDNNTNIELVIAVDATKLALDQTEHHEVMDKTEWATFLKSNMGRITIAVSKIPQGTLAESSVKINEAINQFENNGINVKFYA